MSIDKISQGIAGCINNHGGVQKVLYKIGKNPAMFSDVASFGLASILRPAVLDKLPFKNDKDRKCSKASAISSGVVDLATTTAIFLPLNKGIEKAGQALFSSKNTFYSGNKDAITQFNSITNRGFKLLFLVPIALVRMSMIKPLINKMNSKEDNKVKKRKLDKWV